MRWCVLAAEASPKTHFFHCPIVNQAIISTTGNQAGGAAGSCFRPLCCLFHTSKNLKLSLLTLNIGTLQHHGDADLHATAYLMNAGYGCCTVDNPEADGTYRGSNSFRASPNVQDAATMLMLTQQLKRLPIACVCYMCMLHMCNEDMWTCPSAPSALSASWNQILPGLFSRS